jgi:hypothetical protein
MPDENITNQHQNYFSEASRMMMFRTQLGLLVVLLIALIVTRSDRANAGSTLTAKQVRAEIIGKWFTYKGSKGNMQLRLGSDGKIYGRSTGGHYIQGTFKLKGNRYCSKIKLRNYKEQCGTYSRLGKCRYRYSGTGAVMQRNKCG